MPARLTLTEAEVRELTRKVRYSAQARELRHLGVDYKPRADGSLVVLRSAVGSALGGGTPSASPSTEPNFDAI